VEPTEARRMIIAEVLVWNQLRKEE